MPQSGLVPVIGRQCAHGKITPYDVASPNDVVPARRRVPPHDVIAPYDIEAAKGAVKHRGTPNKTLTPDDVIAPYDVLERDFISAALAGKYHRGRQPGIRHQIVVLQCAQGIQVARSHRANVPLAHKQNPRAPTLPT